MNKIALAATLLMAPPLTVAETPNPADFAIVVHVQSSRLGVTHDGISQDLTATIDGKHYVLEGSPTHQDLLRLGDYKAKLIRQDESRPYEYRWVYQFLFADGKTREFLVIGEDQ